MMDNNFLAVNKNYLSMGLKSIDLLIIAQIEEFKRNGFECYMTNEQFSDLFGESVSTIKRALNSLETKGIIKRKTSIVSNNGQKSKQRILSISKVQNEPTFKQGSNNTEARFKNEKSKVHNEPIKDNIKENIKDKYNIKDKDNYDYLFVNSNDDDMISIVNNWEANMDNMSLDEWISEMKAEGDFQGYTADEVKAIIDYYSL